MRTEVYLKTRTLGSAHAFHGPVVVASAPRPAQGQVPEAAQRATQRERPAHPARWVITHQREQVGLQNHTLANTLFFLKNIQYNILEIREI